MVNRIMATPKSPSVTTHALLGLLAIRPWTAYELTAQMRRALRWAWPRTEANLYNEIRQLAPRGLARATEEESGGRTRTRYEITDAGREALTAWLDTEPGLAQLQFETLLRLFIADQGDREQLLAAVHSSRRQIVETIADVIGVVEDYAGDEPPFPGRAHLNGLFIAFIADFVRVVLEWCDTAEQEIGSWPGVADVGHTKATKKMVDDALAYYRSVLEADEAAS